MPKPMRIMNTDSRRNGWRLRDGLYVLPLVLGLTMVAYAVARQVRATRAGATVGESSTSSDQRPESTRLVGRWGRLDGDYVLEIHSVAARGQILAAYFNPRSIKVAKAQASPSSAGLAVYIELRDEGYPGNNYRLIYDAARDRLAGAYLQPEAQQQFNVIFERLK